MRCDDVARELATPTTPAGPLADAMARHLAACPRCAGAAGSSARLDRAWAATRPAEPAGGDFDRLWAGLSRALAAGAPEPAFGLDPVADVPATSTAPAILPMTARHPWRLAVAVLAPIAAAAALLLMMNPGRDDGQRPAGLEPPPNVVADLKLDPVPPNDPAAPEDPDLALASFEIEQGETGIIHIDDGRPRLETRAPVPVSETDEVAATHDIFGYMETLSSL